MYFFNYCLKWEILKWQIMWQLLRKHLTFDCDFLWMTRRRNLEETGEDNMWFALVPRQSLFIGGEHPSQYTPNKRGPWTKIGPVFHIFFIPSRLSWGGEFLQKLCVCVFFLLGCWINSKEKQGTNISHQTGNFSNKNSFSQSPWWHVTFKGVDVDVTPELPCSLWPVGSTPMFLFLK